MGGQYGGLSGPRLFKLAYRLPAYSGVMQAIARHEYLEQHPELTQPQPAPVAAQPEPVRTIDLTPDMLATGQFAGLIEVGGG